MRKYNETAVAEARIYTRIIPTLINNIKVRLGGARAKRKPSRVIKNFSTPLPHRIYMLERERVSEKVRKIEKPIYI